MDAPPAYSILLVEDEEAHAELIRRAFEDREQYKIELARSLKDAHQCLETAIPHLVISDYRLPDGKGTQLIRTKNGVVPPPVIMMTSQGSEAVAVEAMKHGALDYVVKSPEAFADMPHVADRAIREWHHIVERDEAVAQLRDQEERLRLVTDTVPALIAYIDGAHRYQFVNAGFERWYGHPKEWFLGRAVRSVIGTQAYSAVAEGIDAVLAGRSVSFEGWDKGVGRQPRFVRHGCVPHRRPDGRVVGFYMMMTDVTDMKRAEEERQALQRQLLERERLAAVGTTAAMFAHEVANPLNNMYLHLQLHERNLRNHGGERFADDVQVVKDEVMRLNGLLHEFRSLARDKQPPREVVELAPILEHTLCAHVHREDITVVCRLEQDVPAVKANKDKLKQVLLNLTKNALEAMPSGGQLTVSLRAEKEWVVLEVIDTGVGIPDDVDVFEPFKTTKPGGTGLGLPIVKQIVAAYGGSIEFESKCGSGTTFRIALPAASHADPAVEH